MFCESANLRLLKDSLPLALLLSLFFIEPASAYVDPSTGSYAMQLGMGFFFGALFTLKALLRKISLKFKARRQCK